MIAPDTDTARQQITDTFNANAANSSWVHGLENCVLPVLTPQPDWFADLNAKLKTAQANASDWLTKTSPALFAASTQSYIDYANSFDVTVGSAGSTGGTTLAGLVATVRAAGGKPTPAQQQQLATLAGALLQVAKTQLASATALQARVDAFRTLALADRKLISDGIAAAVQAAGEDSAKIAALQASIQQLMLQFTADNTKVDNADISYGSAIFSTIIGLTFGLVASGGMLGVGVVIGAVISIGSAISSAIVYTEALKQDIANICNLLDQLAVPEQQLALTQGIIGNLNMLASSNEDALEAFTDLTGLWSATVYDLTWLTVVLAQPSIDLNTIPALTSLEDARQAWSDMRTFATQAQSLSLQQPVQLVLPEATVVSMADYRRTANRAQRRVASR